MPKTANECDPWLNATEDAVSACAIDDEAAFARFSRVREDTCTFAELGCIPRKFKSLDGKIRSGMSKQAAASKGANEKLVGRLTKRRDELRKQTPPLQITGLQQVFIVRQFFRIGEGETVRFELEALTWSIRAMLSLVHSKIINI